MFKVRAALLATSLAAGVLASVGGALPASAEEVCQGESTGTQTISVLGEEIYHTPQTSAWVCVTYPTNIPTAPSLEVTKTPARIVELVHPDAGGEQIEVYLFTSVQPYGGGGQQVYEDRALPVPLDGGSTCLFFQGNEVYNPGGCAIEVEGSTTLDDEINDLLDDLP